MTQCYVLRSAARWVAMVYLLFWMFMPEVAYAQVQCENGIQRAEGLFLNELAFDEAIELLEACLSQDAFSQQEKPQVYKLLVQIYEANGLEDQVRTALAELLALLPNYQPDPDDTPEFKQLVASYKNELAEQRRVVQEEADQTRTEMETLRDQVSLQRNEPEVRDLYIAAEQDRAEAVSQYDAGNYEVATTAFAEARDGYEEMKQILDEKFGVAETTQKKGWGKWAAIGGGVVAAGVAAVALGGGGGDGGNGGGTTTCPDGTPPPCTSTPTPIPLPPGRPGGALSWMPDQGLSAFSWLKKDRWHELVRKHTYLPLFSRQKLVLYK